MFSQTTKDSLKADLAKHPALTASGATAGAAFNWAGLITAIESIVNAVVTQILPLFSGGAAANPPAPIPVKK